MESEEIGYIAHFEMGGYQMKVQLENWEQGLERACTLQSLLSRSCCRSMDQETSSKLASHRFVPRY